MSAIRDWSRNETARIAGVVYLINVLTGIFSLAYVPSRLSGHGDVGALVNNLLTHEMLFRIGLVAAIVCFTEFLLLPLVLYKLLKPVSREIAQLMVLLAVVSVPISLMPIVSKLDVLSLMDHAARTGALRTDQLNERVSTLLDAYGDGMLVANVFWGLWLLPFGYLVFKSGFLPRVLGILLMIGCFGYLIDVGATLLSTGYADSPVASYVHVPGSIGEIGTCLWLLIMGARTPVRSEMLAVASQE